MNILHRAFSPRPRLAAAALLVGSLLLANASGQSGPAPAEAAAALRFDVPIHEEPGQDGAATEVWASRTTYKVSFHDGIAFYPVLGTAYDHNLPVTWRTTSIRAGGRELLPAGDAPQVRSTPWRHELHRGAIVEAYDVREDGLEQTFVLATPPPGGGDLVIAGRVSTELGADNVLQPRHGDLVFRDAAGRAIVSYGAGTVFDAAGARAPIVTSHDGHAIRLHVGGGWLASATYPVTVDPLLTSQVVLIGTQASSNPSVAHSGGSRLLVMDSRAVSASDFDTMGVSTVGAFGSPALIFAVTSASTSTPHTRAAYVDEANRWCIAMEIQRTVIVTKTFSVGWHLRDPVDTAFRTVTNRMIIGTSDSQPVVGGDAGGILPGDNALIVFKRGSGAGSAIQAAVIDCVNDSLVKTTRISEPSAVRCEFPDVNEQVEMELDPWVAVWQEEGANGRRQLRMTWIFNDGDTTSVYPLGHQVDLTRHNFTPKIGGQSGAYAVAFIAHPVGSTVPTSPVGSELWVDSIRLNHIVGTNVSKRHLPLTKLISSFNLATSDVAFDTETQSHWGVCSEFRFLTGSYRFDRIGYDGQALESFTVATGLSGVAATYLAASDAFPVIYSDGDVLRGRVATYPAVPAPTPYGQTCGFGTLDSERSHGSLPYAGHERFKLRMSPVSQQVQGILLIGTEALDVPFLGGCNLYVNPVASIPFSTSAVQEYRFRLAIPSSVQARLFAQVVYVTISSSQFGTTNGYAFDIVR